MVPCDGTPDRYSEPSTPDEETAHRVSLSSSTCGAPSRPTDRSALASDDNPVLSRQQQAWLRLVQPIAVVNGFAMLAAPSAFARDNIESVLRGPITRALSTHREPVDLAVKVDTSLAGAQRDRRR